MSRRKRVSVCRVALHDMLDLRGEYHCQDTWRSKVVKRPKTIEQELCTARSPGLGLLLQLQKSMLAFLIVLEEVNIVDD